MATDGHLPSDEVNRDGVGLEDHPVRLDFLAADASEDLHEALCVDLFEAQEVGVPGRPDKVIEPDEQQSRALEDEVFTVRRLRETVEEALDGEAREHLVRVHVLCVGALHEARLDRLDQGVVCGGHATRLSRYGRMTRATRQMRA